MKPEGARVEPPTKVPTLITTPLSWLYRYGITARNRAFDAGRGVTRLDRPVISVGNLSTGGTGKTPMVQLVVRLLQESGHRPVIAMRGYKARPGEKGDEQLEHELALPGVPIVAQPDRRAGLRALFDRDRGSAIDCVVLDDGFQHRKIARDLDIVLIDATRPPQLDALLPKGHLREPIESLRRAGLIVLTHCERVEQAQLDRVKRGISAYAASEVPLLDARHEWGGMVQHTHREGAWQSSPHGLEALQGRSVHLISGIGNAESFETMAMARGVSISGRTRLRDHQALTQSRLASLCQVGGAQEPPDLLMTRKDWVKVGTRLDWPEGATVLVPDLVLKVSDSSKQLRSQLDSVFMG